jgi:hypothetical protein
MEGGGGGSWGGGVGGEEEEEDGGEHGESVGGRHLRRSRAECRTSYLYSDHCYVVRKFGHATRRAMESV